MSKRNPIKAYRDQKSLTVAAFGQIVGASKGTVSKWETGMHGPSPANCLRIEYATKGVLTRQKLRPDLFGRSALQA